MAEINITPFTDVLLVLLIIFMILAAMVTPPGFEKELSNHDGNPPNPAPVKSIEVLVNDRGVIYVDGQRTDASGVYAVMLTERSRLGNRHVDVIGDGKTKYGSIVRVLDACKVAGLDDVQFVTQ
jgi:biopolymer transport protein ExbD